MVSVLDEHHGYLCIAGRTERYGAAIDQCINEGDVIADLGCGVGVLGLQCLQSGAARAYGIDYSDAVELARETMARAGLADRYTSLRESTFRVQLPEPVDAIICDHVGYFGFDYGIAEMIADARRRLLKPGGTVIPRRIDPVVAGVSSDSCRTKAEGWTGPTIPDEYRWINSYARNTKHAHSFAPGDLCTSPVTLGTIRLDMDDADHYAMSGTLTVDHDGLFDGLAGWFNCELAEGIWMTNSPVADDRIDRSNVFLPCNQPFPVRAGDRIAISLRFRTDGEMIVWTVTPPGGMRQRMSTWNSRILTQADLAAETGRPPILTPAGRARQIICALVDGVRTASEIEQELLAVHPDLFPTPEEISRFVRRELGHSTE